MEKLITVTVTDKSGNTFSQDWKREANRIDAIRWTIESSDTPIRVKANEIVSVIVTETEK